MLQTVHKRIIQKSKAYRDWHRSKNSSIANALFLVIFSFYLSSVVWMAANPNFLKESEDLKVLGVSAGPSNLAYEMNRNKITVTPVATENRFSVLATTRKDSNVWVEYDSGVDGFYLKTQKTDLSMTHLIDLSFFEKGEEYIYRIAAKDVDGYTVYSRFYSFRK